jgi:GH25 family lysozyme M1 (1,4-beta-N-acetylmuramidase)
MTTETRPALRYPGFVDGLDISVAQAVHDYQAVADDGFVFITAKTSEGAGYCDPKVLEFLHGFRAVGLVCNVYTFLRPSQGDARAQVRKAFECSGDMYPLRLALDLEGAPDGMSSEAIVAFAEEAVDECLSFGVLLPEFYSFPDYVRRRLMPALARSTVLGRCPLWMAHYGSNTDPWVPPRGFAPFTPAPWSTWTKHQYSGNGGYRVRGIYGDVDRDLFNGDREAFRLYMGLPSPVADDPMPIIHPLPTIDTPTEET